MGSETRTIREAIQELVTERRPGWRLVSTSVFGVDTHDHDSTSKATGYGRPVRVGLVDARGEHHDLVLHTATANDFGHDRRADRAAEMILAFDTFGDVPNHVKVHDMGAILQDGSLLSLSRAREFFVLTEYAPGSIYADDLRRVAQVGGVEQRDLDRARTLGAYLAALHQPVEGSRPAAYTRAIRDLVGDGEGIFGIVDGYPEPSPGAPRAQLMAIERACVEWRWRLRGSHERLVRTHGDFHPFNILFDDASGLRLLDASRGCVGDAADDVTALAVNYVFFALQTPGSWEGGFRRLWDTFWEAYFDGRNDPGLLSVAPPFFAWRALVVSNPTWYPDIDPAVRVAMLGLAARSLEAGALSRALTEVNFP